MALAKHHTYREIQETIILVNDDIDDIILIELFQKHTEKRVSE